jgi:hypothetical protein
MSSLSGGGTPRPLSLISGQSQGNLQTISKHFSAAGSILSAYHV